jgi:hypothetical protein
MFKFNLKNKDELINDAYLILKQNNENYSN